MTETVHPSILAANIADHQNVIRRQKAEIEQLEAALRDLLAHYVQLVECGDCGFWDPEKEPQVMAARAALNPDRVKMAGSRTVSAIVAWLRARAAHHTLCHEQGVTAINHHSAALVVSEYADAIERGEHEKELASSPVDGPVARR
jgi:hypothetical protein